MTFEEPDLKKFKTISLAFQSARTGGTAPAVMNAANEIAVALFLQEKIRFDQIAVLIEETLTHHNVITRPTVANLLESDKWAREFLRKQYG